VADPAGAGPAAISTVFRSGCDGYASFRIPAVVQQAGELLVFAEGRRGGPADSGRIDLVLRRSGDGGQTWTPLAVVCSGGDHTVGNPVPIAVPDSSRIVLLLTRNDGAATEADILAGRAPARSAYVTVSADAGHSWSTPAELGSKARDDGWRWYATGPGHGIVLRHGPHAGRLLAPANHSRAPERAGQAGTDPALYGGHGLVSDDGGRSWRIGYRDDQGDAAVNANETAVAELPDGQVYVNARNQQGTAVGHRAHAWSRDGGEHLTAPMLPVPADQLTVPQVQASLLCPEPPAGGRPIPPLLFSGPDHPDQRRGMAVRASRDGGHTWSVLARVTSAPAGYSDLVDLGWPLVGLAFETGTTAPHQRIDFARVRLVTPAPTPRGRREERAAVPAPSAAACPR